MKLKPLDWTHPLPPNEDCMYDHVTAETPFGRFLLTWKSWKSDPGFGFDETPWGDVVYQGWSNIAEARAWAESELFTRCLMCLE